MFRDKEKFNLALTQFLDASPTPFHAVSSMASMLKNEGFTELSEDDEWALEVGSRHFVTRNGSSMIAFIVGKAPLLDTGIKMVGAHTDSPCLMVKPQPEITKQGYLQLGVEVYGGALLNPWFDRDLSIAGRVVYQDASGNLKQTLVDFKRAVATIPSLAIHLDREANTGHSVNAQTDILPILMQVSGSSASFRELLSDQFLKDDEKVVDYELCFYYTQQAAVVGLQNEWPQRNRKGCPINTMHWQGLVVVIWLEFGSSLGLAWLFWF